MRGKSARRFETIFRICARKLYFIVSVHFLFSIALHDIIGLKIFPYLSPNHNPELRCVIFTGVTLFAGVTLELHCSQPIKVPMK